MRISVYPLLILILLFASCSRDFDEVYSFDVENWHEKEVITASFEHISGDSVMVVLRLTHSTAYNYENLYIKISHTDADMVDSEVRSISLIDNSGNWIGKCRNTKCTLDETIINRRFEDDLTPFSVSIAQYSRDSVLAGIENITLGADYY